MRSWGGGGEGIPYFSVGEGRRHACRERTGSNAMHLCTRLPAVGASVASKLPICFSPSDDAFRSLVRPLVYLFDGGKDSHRAVEEACSSVHSTDAVVVTA